MANPRIPYRFSNDGPSLKPPPQGAIMVHLVVNVEHWQFEANMPRTIITPPHGKETIPDVPNFSWADYGMRAGLPRMIDAIVQRGLPASTSFNAGVIQAYPRAAQAMHAAGWEFIGHGVHQRALNHSDGPSEEQLIATTLDMISALTGERPQAYTRLVWRSRCLSARGGNAWRAVHFSPCRSRPTVGDHGLHS